MGNLPRQLRATTATTSGLTLVQCSTDHWNVIEKFKHVHTVEDCQHICQSNQECRFWSYYDKDHCALLRTCESLKNCPGDDYRDDGCDDYLKDSDGRCPCWSGPVFPDLDDC